MKTYFSGSPLNLLANTNQEAFDRAFEGVYKQGGRCMQSPETGQVSCAYTNNEGKACAIGQLIPEAYRALMPNVSAGELLGDGYIDIGDIHIDLLAEMQESHDTMEDDDLQEYCQSMRAVASSYKLSPAIIDRLAT